MLASGERVARAPMSIPTSTWAISRRRRQLRRRHLVPVPAARGRHCRWRTHLLARRAAAEVLSVYREFLPSAPRDLGGFFAFHIVPPAPPFPEEIHLRKVCGVVWCYAGPEEDAARAMAPLLDNLPEPLMHGVQPMPHPALQSAFDDLYPSSDQWYWRADYVEEIPDDAVQIHAKFGAEMPTLKSAMHLYPVNGAAHDVVRPTRPGATVTHTGARRSPASIPTRQRGRDPALDRRLPGGPPSLLGRRRLREHDDGRGPGRVRASYRDNYDRLARIKATYDPDNAFRINQNIEPKR